MNQMAEFNQQRAIEDYTELSRRVQVGAYIELEHDGSFPPDDGSPESTTLESLHNLEEWAASRGQEFSWDEASGSYTLIPMTEETQAARRAAEYNRDIDERNEINLANREKPWLPLHDGE